MNKKPKIYTTNFVLPATPEWKVELKEAAYQLRVTASELIRIAVAEKLARDLPLSTNTSADVILN